MSENYTKVAIAFHWMIGLAIIAMLGMGLILEDIPSDYQYIAYQLHKSIGLTILLLSFLRLFWRLTHRAPALPAGMKTWEILASKITHVAFYVLMIGIPLSGWALVSSAPAPYDFPIQWFGLFEWPSLPLERSKEVSHDFSELHEMLAFLTIGLLALHIGAALKHHFMNRDNVLVRMLPCLKKCEK